ncbi:MAG: TonB-dependent receptor, partial [Flavobacteriales bacterium]|nr:TonB-dependent receptor [Flavobacteriales bacterium]
MIKRITLLLSLIITGFAVQAQIGQGSIKGKIVDKETGETLPFVNVIAERNGNMVTGASTDFDGVYTIKPLAPGKYDIKFKFVGYQEIVMAGVVVNSDQETTLNAKMGKGVELKEAVVIDFKQPLFKKDETVQKTSMGAEAIDRMATRSFNGVAKTVGGIYSQDDGQNKLNSRGSRDDANYVFIDGVKVRGSNALPKAALEEVSVITGGLPAQYGDVTGAVISITTKGGAREFAGGVDYLTSGYKFGDKVYGLDAFGYNLLEFNATGPLLWKKDSAGNKTDPLLSFFVAGNGTHIVDPQPSGIGMWKVKDDKLEELRENPLSFNPVTGGTVLNHEFLRLSDLEKVKTRQNVARQGLNLIAKLDINTGRNTTLTFGATLDLNQNTNDNYRSNSANVIVGNLLHNTLMNTEANPEFINNTWRVYSRFTQRFGSSSTDEKSASLIKNAYYTLQVDYQQRTQKRQSAKHKDRLFDYGYVGKFTTFQQRTYGPGFDSVLQIGALIHQTFEDTLVAYEEGTINPDMARIT